MCGIVAVFGQIGVPEEKLFADLLQVDVIRGPDSTGIVAINPDGSAATYKDCLLPTDLLLEPGVRKLFKGMKRGLIGHNRAATKGKINRRNAHPFISGHIVGVHNGTIDNEYHLLNGNKFGTDSEAIFDHIEKKGIEDAWKNIDGGTALVWWDAKQKTFNFIRNSKRPLFFAYGRDKRNVIVASEEWMIQGCADRRIGIEVEKTYWPKADDHFIFQYDFHTGLRQFGGSLTPFVRKVSVPVSGHGKGSYKWDGSKFDKEDKNKGNAADVLFPEYANEGKGGKQDPLATRTGGKSECSDGTSPDKGGQKNGTMSPDPQSISPLPKEVFKKTINKKRFRKVYKNCTFCSVSLDDQYEEAVILDDNNAACHECATIGSQAGIRWQKGM